MYKFCDMLALLVGVGVLMPMQFMTMDWRAALIQASFCVAVYFGLRQVSMDAKRKQGVL